MAWRLRDRARFGAKEGVLGEAASAVAVVLARAVGTRGSASREDRAVEAREVWLGLSPSAAARPAAGQQGVCPPPESDGTFDTFWSGRSRPLALAERLESHHVSLQVSVIREQ